MQMNADAEHSEIIFLSEITINAPNPGTPTADMEHGKILQFNYFHFILTLVFATRTNLFLGHDLRRANYRWSSRIN